MHSFARISHWLKSSVRCCSSKSWRSFGEWRTEFRRQVEFERSTCSYCHCRIWRKMKKNEHMKRRIYRNESMNLTYSSSVTLWPTISHIVLPLPMLFWSWTRKSGTLEIDKAVALKKSTMIDQDIPHESAMANGKKHENHKRQFNRISHKWWHENRFSLRPYQLHRIRESFYVGKTSSGRFRYDFFHWKHLMKRYLLDCRFYRRFS